MTQDPAQPNNKRYRRYYTYIEPVIVDPVIKGYFTLIASMLLTAFFILFAVAPTFSTIVGLYRHIQDQKALIKTMDTKISNLIVAQVNYTGAEPYLPLLTVSFPQKPAPESIITGTLRVATVSGVSVSAFQISPTYLAGTQPPPLTDAEVSQTTTDVTKSTRSELISALKIPIVEFSVTVHGSEPNIRAFMVRMQNLPRIITFSQIVIGVDEDQSTPDLNNFVGNISAVAYYYPKNYVNSGQ